MRFFVAKIKIVLLKYDSYLNFEQCNVTHFQMLSKLTILSLLITYPTHLLFWGYNNVSIIFYYYFFSFLYSKLWTLYTPWDLNIENICSLQHLISPLCLLKRLEDLCTLFKFKQNCSLLLKDQICIISALKTSWQ